MGVTPRQGIIYLGLDDRFLIGRCGHYAIYGSEYLLCLAVRIGCEDELKKIGKPTVLEFDIPFEEIEYLDALAHSIADELLYQLVRPSNIERVDHAEVFRRINKDSLVNHYHPQKIPDPQRSHLVYDSTSNSYTSEDGILY